MDWRRGPAIGCGSTATVYLATTVPSGEPFAVKSTELSCSSLLQKEQRILSKLSSKFLVKYLGFDVRHENSKPMYNLFMEYVPGGTLLDEIARQGGKLDEPMIRSYTGQILQGLDYLHENGLAHCDIKCQNILIGSDGLKIADLGCAKMVEKAAGSVEISGTPAFMAPEVARGEEQGFEADVWALGCTLIEMASGKHPWGDFNEPVLALYKIGFSNEVPEVPFWLSDKAKDFLTKCLMKVPTERWTAKELLEHPFFTDLESESECSTSSPCCVLDKDFWDSFEVLQSPLNLTHDVSCSSNISDERMKKLTGNDSLSILEIPNWDYDEDWITVRSNIIDGDIDFSDQPSNSNLSETALVTYEEEDRTEFDGEDFLLNYSSENIITNSISNGIVEYNFVLVNVNFEQENKNFSLSKSQFQISYINIYLLCFMPILSSSNITSIKTGGSSRLCDFYAPLELPI